MKIHSDVFADTRTQVAHICAHMCALTAPVPTFTEEEFIDAFVPDEHKAILQDAAEIVHVQLGNCNMSMPAGSALHDVEFMFKSDRYLTPRHLFPQDNQTYRDVHAQITAWRHHTIEHRRLAETARHVFVELVERCASAAAIRYVWPCVVHLQPAGCSSRGQAFFDKVAAFKPVSEWPGFNTEMKGALRETKEWLTAFKLVEDEKPAVKVPHMRMDARGFEFELDGYKLYADRVTIS